MFCCILIMAVSVQPDAERLDVDVLQNLVHLVDDDGSSVTSAPTVAVADSVEPNTTGYQRVS